MSERRPILLVEPGDAESSLSAGGDAPSSGGRGAAAILERRPGLAVLPPAAVATALGLWGLSRSNSMWRDESVTYQVAHRSFLDIWRLLPHVDAVHGLYYLLMHGVFSAWDGGLTALRLPSVLAYVATSMLVAAIARRLGDVRCGVLTGIAYAVLPMAQKYGQEGRSYALVAAGVAAATYALVRARDPVNGSRWLVGYGAALAAAGLLNEFALLALPAHAAFVLAAAAYRRIRVRWCVAASAACVVVAPLAVVSRSQSREQLHWLGRPPWWDITLYLLLSTVAVLVSVRLWRRPGARSRAVVRLGLPLFIVPPFVLMLVSEVFKPLYVDRYVAYSYIGLVLVLGRGAYLGLARLGGLRRPALIVVGLAIGVSTIAVLLPWSLAMRTPLSRKDDVVAIRRATESVSRPGDGVLFLPARRREWLLWHPVLRSRLDDFALDKSPTPSRTLDGVEADPSDVVHRMLRHKRILVLQVGPELPSVTDARDAAKEVVLRARFHAVRAVAERGGYVVVWERNDRDPSAGSTIREGP